MIGIHQPFPKASMYGLSIYTGDLPDRILSCRSNSVKKIDHNFFIFFEPTDRIFGVDKNESQLRLM